MLVDVHAHLDFPQFEGDRGDVIKRAERGRIVIVNSGIGLEGMNATLKLTREYRNIFATLGISPREFNENEIKNCIAMIRKNKDKIIGIGEVGLDYYWIKEPKKRKKSIENFKRFVELSNELNLPLVVHSRNAEKDAINIIRDSGARAILHCFSGSVKQAKEAILSKSIISVPTSVVYSKQKQEIVKKIGLEHLVLETDSPYLSPVPGTRNEPMNLNSSVQKIADIKNIDSEVIVDATTENFRRFFNSLP